MNGPRRSYPFALGEETEAITRTNYFKASTTVLAAILVAGLLLTLIVAGTRTAKAQSLPQNGKIAFTSEWDGNEEIYMMNPDGTNQTRLTNNPAADRVPHFSPDGARIAFTSDRSGRYKIYTMNSSNGSGQTRLAGTRGSDYGPDFSPDGTKIAFYSYGKRTAGGDIFTMNADGTSATRLTKANGDDTLPSWGPATTP